MAGEIKFLLPSDSSYSHLLNFHADDILKEQNNRVVIGGITNDTTLNRLRSFFFIEGFAWFVPKDNALPDESNAVSDSVVIKPIPSVESAISNLFQSNKKLVPQFYILENIRFTPGETVNDWLQNGRDFGNDSRRFYTKHGYPHSRQDKTINFTENFFFDQSIFVENDPNQLLFVEDTEDALLGIKILSTTGQYIDPHFFFKFLKKNQNNLFISSDTWVDTLPTTMSIHFVDESGLPCERVTLVDFANTGTSNFTQAEHFQKHGNEYFSAVNPPVGKLRLRTDDIINGHLVIHTYPFSSGINSSGNNFIYIYQMIDSFDQVVFQVVNISDWFSQQASSSLQYYTFGNKVKMLIDGQETFREMLATMNETSQSTDFVYLAGWSIDMNFKIVDLVNHHFFDKNLKEVFTEINNRNVKIRCMFWDADELFNWFISAFHIGRAAWSTIEVIRSIVDPKKKVSMILQILLSPQAQAKTAAKKVDLINNIKVITTSLEHLVFKDDDINLRRPSCQWINEHLNNGKAIADHKIRNLVDHGSIGSHHQKLMIIKAGQNVYGFCGGIDIYADRAKPHNHPTFPGQHDVHCKIEGPAVKDMWLTFKQRWEDHPESNSEVLPSIPDIGPKGKHIVQIARTYPTQMNYGFTGGEQIIFQTILKSFTRARRHIYIEDQYAISPDMAFLLNKFVLRPTFEGLVIVIPHWKALSPFAGHVKEFLNTIAPPGTDPAILEKIFIFHVDNSSEDYTYIHAKTTIVDDFFVTIGSANMNHRSHTHDTEINAMIIDTEVVHGKRKFARDLRIKLWKEHLGINSVGEAELKLSDFKSGMSFLKTSSRIKRFKPPILSADSLIDDNLYTTLVDPIT